jgi:hypothetical protein
MSRTGQMEPLVMERRRVSTDEQRPRKHDDDNPTLLDQLATADHVVHGLWVTALGHIRESYDSGERVDDPVPEVEFYWDPRIHWGLFPDAVSKAEHVSNLLDRTAPLTPEITEWVKKAAASLSAEAFLRLKVANTRTTKWDRLDRRTERHLHQLEKAIERARLGQERPVEPARASHRLQRLQHNIETLSSTRTIRNQLFNVDRGLCARFDTVCNGSFLHGSFDDARVLGSVLRSRVPLTDEILQGLRRLESQPHEATATLAALKAAVLNTNNTLVADATSSNADLRGEPKSIPRRMLETAGVVALNTVLCLAPRGRP